MRDTVLDVSTSDAEAEAPPRNVILFGVPSFYQDALKCMIESRSPDTTVTQISDEGLLIQNTLADLVLYDIELETVSEQRLRQVAMTFEKLAPRPVLLLSTGVDLDVLQQLLSEGAAGIVLKSSSSETLLEAIRSVADGKVWLQREMLAQTFGESSHTRRSCSQAARIALLTLREREIVSVTSSGLTNKLVAERLQISEATVRHHLSSIFGKLGATNRAELIVFAYRHGLTASEDRQRLC